MHSRDHLEKLFIYDMGWETLDTHQSKNIFELLYHAAQSCSPQSIVLDISAGQCRYKSFFEHAQYIAIDSMVGDESWNYSRLDLIGDAFKLPIKDSIIDVCLNFTSLEHYPTPQKAFDEVARVLKPGGKLFLYVPCVIGEHQIPYDFFRYTRYGLAHLVKTSGLDVEFIKPSNAIFETTLGLLKSTIDYLPNCPAQNKVKQVFREVIEPILADAEKVLPASADYPEVNPYPQLPSAYCLFARKSGISEPSQFFANKRALIKFIIACPECKQQLKKSGISLICDSCQIKYPSLTNHLDINDDDEHQIKQNFDMIDCYLQMSLEVPGEMIIRNQIESDICREHTVGNKILKVDFQNSILKIEYADNQSIDTLIAIDLILKESNRKNMLDLFSKKISANGNIITSFYSLDHWNFFSEEPVDDKGIFENSVTLNQLMEEAAQAGLSVVESIPYGFADRNARYRHPFNGQILTQTDAWSRHLSWLSVDKELSNFIFFLENKLVRYLPVAATSRFIAILKKRDRHHCYEPNNLRIDMNARFNLDELAALLPCSRENWKAMINEHLGNNMRSMVIFFLFWSSFWRTPDHFGYSSFLDKNHLNRLEMWWEQAMTNQKALAMVRRWYLQENIDKILTYSNINLGSCIESNLVPEILKNYFYAFEANHQ